MSETAKAQDHPNGLVLVQRSLRALSTSTLPILHLVRPRPAAARTASWAEQPLHDPVGGRVKRLIDIVVALSTLILMAPVLCLAAAGVRLTLGGPVLFTQRRIGFGGRPFLCYKFRTMAGGDEVLYRHLESDLEAAREWQETQKLRKDPRVTRFGHLLRKSSIDELPQLINVLRGEMSCVGPRPVLAPELDRYGTYAHEYMAARPGLTGLWQVKGRNRLTYRDRVALDRFYVRKWSIGLDLMILLRTIPAVTRSDETS